MAVKPQPKRVVKHRRQYKLNWLQILRKVEEALEVAETEKPPQLSITVPLAEAIEAMKERMYS